MAAAVARGRSGVIDQITVDALQQGLHLRSSQERNTKDFDRVRGVAAGFGHHESHQIDPQFARSVGRSRMSGRRFRPNDDQWRWRNIPLSDLLEVV